MTLPQNVKDALGYVDMVFDDCDNVEWKTIRDHLMSQEAELADYKNASLHAADDCLAKDAEIERLRASLAKHVARVCELQSQLAVLRGQDK